MQHYIEQGIATSLFYLVFNRMMHSSSKSMLQRKFIRWPCALASSAIWTFILNRFLLRDLYLKDLKELSLEKYFVLDLNADMMKEDLNKLGI